MARKITFFILCASIFLTNFIEAKVYSQCEFAQALLKYGITNRNHLGTWTCIAYYESKLDTSKVSSTGDYGILQLNQNYWCSNSNTAGKGCGITCKSLLVDNISGSIKCALTVYAETQRLKGDGFKAWTVYQTYCQGNQDKWISGCSLK